MDQPQRTWFIIPTCHYGLVPICSANNCEGNCNAMAVPRQKCLRQCSLAGLQGLIAMATGRGGVVYGVFQGLGGRRACPTPATTTHTMISCCGTCSTYSQKRDHTTLWMLPCITQTISVLIFPEVLKHFETSAKRSDFFF